MDSTIFPAKAPLRFLNLKYHSEDTGFCRIYFKDEKRRLFCLQVANSIERAIRHGLPAAEWLLCTPDGEPQEEIRSGIIKSIEVDPGVINQKELLPWILVEILAAQKE